MNRQKIDDPVIDEQASGREIDETAPEAPGARRPWREPVRPLPEGADPDWAGGEATGKSGGGMPEPAGQTEEPGTDTDISLPRPKERINLDEPAAETPDSARRPKKR